MYFVELRIVQELPVWRVSFLPFVSWGAELFISCLLCRLLVGWPHFSASLFAAACSLGVKKTSLLAQAVSLFGT